MDKKEYVKFLEYRFKVTHREAVGYFHEILDTINFIGFGEEEPDIVITSFSKIVVTHLGTDIELSTLIRFINENGELSKKDWDKIVKLTTKEP